MIAIRIRSAIVGLVVAGALIWGIATAQQATHPPLPYQSRDKSMGVVNCANSLCHGSIEKFAESNVLQTEYVTWSRVDKHARAYKCC